MQAQNGWLSRILTNDDFQTSPMSLELPVRRSYTPLRPSAKAMASRIGESSAGGSPNSTAVASSLLFASGKQQNINNNNNSVLTQLPPLQDLSSSSSPLKKSGDDNNNKNSPAHSTRSSGRGGTTSLSESQLLKQQHHLLESQKAQAKREIAAITSGVDLASPIRDVSRVAEAAPVVHEVPPHENDPFFVQEQAIVSEIKLLRHSPVGYANTVTEQLLLTRPFLPAAHKKLNLAGMKAFVAERTKQRTDIVAELEQLDEKHKAEVQALRDQWFADDNDRHKKRKNPAATPGMKKADAEKALQQMLEEQENDRNRQIADMDNATEELRKQLRHRMAVVTLELDEGKDGVDYLTKLINRLQTTRPLIAASNNRALCISARTIADESGRKRNYTDLSGSLVGIEKERLAEVCSRFGVASGGYLGIAALIGPARTARETVFEMLLSLADRKYKRSRHALLDPRTSMLGVAWRKKLGDPVADCNTVSVVLTCSHFAELTAISDRNHLNVDVLRREVPAACSVMPATSYDAYTEIAPAIKSLPVSPLLATTQVHTTTATPEDPEGSLVAGSVELVAPTRQPCHCGNEAELWLRCGVNAAIYAVLLKEGTEANLTDVMSSLPHFCPGEQLVQREPETGLVHARVKLPHAGTHHVAVFLRDGSDVFRRVCVASFVNNHRRQVHSQQEQQNSKSSSSIKKGSSSSSSPSATAAAFSSSSSSSLTTKNNNKTNKTRNTNNKLNENSSFYDPREAWRRYPILSSDFADRNGYLLEPLDGVLAPDSEVTFRVSLPISAHYKGREKQRIAKLIEEAKTQESHCKEAMQHLLPKLEESKKSLETVVSTKDSQIHQLQTEIAGYQKDLQRRKSGKEHDRLKHLVVDAEKKMKNIEAAELSKKRVVENLEEELEGYQRTLQQAAAMCGRYEAEQEILAECTDRSKPLLVELATDERRATLAPTEEGNEEYSARIRTPGAGGHVSLFVGGALAILFDVLPPPPHFLTSITAKPIRLDS